MALIPGHKSDLGLLDALVVDYWCRFDSGDDLLLDDLLQSPTLVTSHESGLGLRLLDNLVVYYRYRFDSGDDLLLDRLLQAPNLVPDQSTGLGLVFSEYLILQDRSQLSLYLLSVGYTGISEKGQNK